MEFAEKLLTLRKAKELTQEQRQQKMREYVLYVIVIYLVLLAVYFFEREFYFFWELEWLGKGALIAEFLLATAMAVFVCARKLGR